MDLNKEGKSDPEWTFFSNYAHVLVCFTRSPQPTIREIAVLVGITERAVQRIVSRLVEAKVVTIEKTGRRNSYSVDFDYHLRHPLEGHCTIGDVLRLLHSTNPNGIPMGGDAIQD